MEKQFVTYEIALKLKKLGFDEQCLAYYKTNYTGIDQTYTGELVLGKNPEHLTCQKQMQYIFGQQKYLAPLWQQAIDWFRCVYKIHISIPNHYDGYCIDIRNFINDTSYYSLPEKWFENYHEARNEAILKAIELIKEK